MADEAEVHRAIQAAGGKAAGPDRYVMAGTADTPDVYVEIERAGKKRELEGLKFWVAIAAGTGGLHQTALDWLPRVELLPEGGHHRAAKARGAVRELQSGDETFDQQIYVSTAARDGEVAPLLADAGFRRAALAVFAIAIEGIELINGRRPRLVLDPGSGAITKPSSFELVAARARELHAALPAFRATGWRLRLGPGGLLAYATALAAAPAGLAAMVTTDTWETVNNDLGWHAALVSLLPYALIVVLARWRASKSSRGVARLWTVVVAGAVAFPTSAIAAAYAANAELDESVSIRTVMLDTKYETKGSKSTFLHARLLPWPPLTEPVIITLGSPAYNQLPEHGPIRAQIGDGWLGYTWVGDLYPPE